MKSDECLPIKSLDVLKYWTKCDSDKHFTCPLQKRTPVTDFPKTLVCHDMKGGYLEDRFLYGSSSEDNYYFIHWSMVDIFVYFSHNLVTIPPCGWITAAHRNGVKILGTFITEWDAGAEICNDILSNKKNVHEICLQLVNIAKSYQFDGWLLNIENKLKAEQVPLLEEFVAFLTLKMHESQKDSLVIWYDSVIHTGELKWQNALNELNRNFFDACDGIFLNYNWDKEKLKKSVEAAGYRKMDIFVGVDVFGRGCLGGGGFSTNIAVMAARDFDLSVAIFAPGWVYECLDVKCFKENQCKFWNSLSELCASRVFESLPYYTSFCPGFGKKMFRKGKVICHKPWYNMSLQQPQPSFYYANCPSSKSIINLYNDDAFNGGGCLQLISSNSTNRIYAKFEILKANFFLKSTCHISYCFKPMNENVEVALECEVSDGKQSYNISFVDKTDGEIEKKPCNICLCCRSLEVQKVSSASKIIMGSISSRPWIKRKYKLCTHTNKSCYIRSISLCLSSDNISESEFSVLLGELSVSPILSDISFDYKDLKILTKNESDVILECVLQWTPSTSISSYDLFIRIDGAKSYICTTSQFCYRFKSTFSKVSEIEFLLYPECLGKTPLPLALKIPLNSDKND